MKGGFSPQSPPLDPPLGMAAFPLHSTMWLGPGIEKRLCPSPHQKSASFASDT